VVPKERAGRGNWRRLHLARAQSAPVVRTRGRLAQRLLSSSSFFFFLFFFYFMKKFFSGFAHI
jgi:hypothetical protein